MDTHTEVSQLALTNVEQALVNQVKAGEVLDLAGATLAAQQVDEKTMQSWGHDRTIRAAVIRDILRGRLALNPDPHGLRLRGARIEGTLDLDHLTSTVPINLAYCLLSEGMVARDATLPTVTLQECWLEHTSQPLVADRLTTTLLALTRSTVIAHSEDGGVSLEGAHLGQLEADGATLTNDTGPALIADGLNVDQDVSLSGGFTATGDGAGGAVRLLGGHIGGQLACTGATLTNKTGPALYADGLNVDQDVSLSGAFTAKGGGPDGAVRLPGGHIGGQLACTGATLTNDTGPALYADRLNVDQDVFLSGGFTGDGKLGAVRLPGGHIGGMLNCTGAAMTNDTGPALCAEGLNVDQDVVLSGAFTAKGGGPDGAVRLLGGHIGGMLNCTGATLTNKTGARPVRRPPEGRPGRLPQRGVHRRRRGWRGPPPRRPHRRSTGVHGRHPDQRHRARPVRRRAERRPGASSSAARSPPKAAARMARSASRAATSAVNWRARAPP